MTTQLLPHYDNHASFYGKAYVTRIGDNITALHSYNTHVAQITGPAGYPSATAEVFGTYSATTLRHIKEFLKQNGFKAESKQQIINDYLTLQ